MAYRTIEVTPIGGTMGAEVAGIDLARPLGNEQLAEIHQAFLENQVLVFHDQDLSIEQNKAFARRFGPLVPYPFVKGLDDHPEVFEIRKEPDEEKNFGGAWHTDMSFEERPPVATMLYARETPSRGGDTLLADLYRAYETLSDTMKGVVGGLRGVYSGDLKGRRGGRKALMDSTRFQAANVDRAGEMEAEHPLVRTHPETGRKALYVSGSHLYRIAGMTDAESAALVGFLKSHAETPDFTCRVGYRPGTLVVWDNRCTQHRALNDYPGERRVMHRLTIGGGDRPH
ncbi:TauD/TfdA family dioxygenase [Thalassobaculum sp.]|uniref:TauD/TfdA dioxygenase family protein n=1 Tax=Thalassobaculum sp. TaxID=2022740 RepID=UPI0032EEED4D